MIVYLDTSALVPLVVHEPTSGSCAEIWDSADAVVGTRLCYVEAVAALAMAVQMGRIGPDVQEECVGVLDELWSGVDVIELDETLMRSASMLALTHGLRGYDATHCAAAVLANDEAIVAASGDQHLLAALRAEGVAVWETNAGRNSREEDRAE